MRERHPEYKEEHKAALLEKLQEKLGEIRGRPLEVGRWSYWTDNALGCIFTSGPHGEVSCNDMVGGEGVIFIVHGIQMYKLEVCRGILEKGGIACSGCWIAGRWSCWCRGVSPWRRNCFYEAGDKRKVG